MMKPHIRADRRYFHHSQARWGSLAWMYRRCCRIGRYWYCRLVRMTDSPERLARGFAVGIFSGFFPFLGAQIIVALLLAIPFRGNKLVAALGTWISNPLTYLPLYLFNFKVGCLVLGSMPDFSPDGLSSADALLALKEEFLSALLVGCAVSGLVAGTVGYFVALRSIRSWRQRRRTQRRRRHRQPDRDRTPELTQR
ncbi:MAG: DUF2062 domain-containing protein [Cyanobacteria bacterium J055]|nr:MAG: DUF2062 domain-containing protein [Cyanobacteria bacterium J055]